jgi:AbrB family looped-hinge helix DNA binding protein
LFGVVALFLHVTDISKISLTISGEIMVEASTTKVSSKGQVVIPVNVRKAAGLKKGEALLAIAFNDTVVLKKLCDSTFEETVKPIWDKVRRMGLTEETVDALIQEAKTKSSS